MNIQLKRKLMTELNNLISKCNDCYDITYCNIGYGSLNPKLFVIGQSLHTYNPLTPKRQIPFVGPNRIDSGRLLYEILYEADFGITMPKNIKLPSIEKSNIYIVNLVAGHPPNNRPLKKTEIKKCSPYLDKIISIIKPRLFLLLGVDVKKYFKFKHIDTGKLINVTDRENKTYIIVPHPAYILRNRSLEKEYRKKLIKKLEFFK